MISEGKSVGLKYALLISFTWLFVLSSFDVIAYEYCVKLPPECGDSFSMSDPICEKNVLIMDL